MRNIYPYTCSAKQVITYDDKYFVKIFSRLSFGSGNARRFHLNEQRVSREFFLLII